MSYINNYFAIYELDGDLANAAKTLIKAERSFLSKEREKSGASDDYRPLSPIMATRLREDLRAHLEKEHPEEYQSLGLNFPAIQIKKTENAHPRAYEHFPFITAAGNDEDPSPLLLLCPKDYKGEHYAPEGISPIGKNDLVSTGTDNLVYKQKYLLSPPLVYSSEKGAALPADFAPQKHSFEHTEMPDGLTSKVFIAGGMSLSCVSEFLKRKEELKKARKDVEDELKKIVPDLDQDVLLNSDPDKETKTACDFNVDEQGKTQVWIKAYNNDLNHGSGLSCLIALKDNDHFITNDFKNGFFRITPNKDTQAGHRLDRLFSKMGSMPKLETYWQIYNPTAPDGIKSEFNWLNKDDLKVPEIDSINGIHYLIYTIDPSKDDNCNPPGSIPVSTEEYLWLKADLKDAERGIRLPKPPEQLEHMRPIKPKIEP